MRVFEKMLAIGSLVKKALLGAIISFSGAGKTVTILRDGKYGDRFRNALFNTYLQTLKHVTNVLTIKVIAVSEQRILVEEYIFAQIFIEDCPNYGLVT